MACCGSGCHSHRNASGSELAESKSANPIPPQVDQNNSTPATDASPAKQITAEGHMIGTAAHEHANKSDCKSSQTSQESCSRSGLSCISDASAKQSRISTSASGQKKRKARDEEPGTGGNEADADNGLDIFEFLAPSDLRLTPKALVETHISHFRCNVNGCTRHYRSHTALARHRREKHAEWTSHVAHSYEEACALRQHCVDGHCGGEHECAGTRPPPAGSPPSGDEEAVCAGAVPHCHVGEQWPPDSKSVFRCPEPSCAHTAGQVQALRYHYLRTHGSEAQFPCASCGRVFALKSDHNRHAASCGSGLRCECGKLLRTAAGLATHRRIFHRQPADPPAPGAPTPAPAADGVPGGAESAAAAAGAAAGGGTAAAAVAAAGGADAEGGGSGDEGGDDLRAHMEWLLPSDFALSEHALFSARREGGLFLCGFHRPDGGGGGGGARCGLRFRNLADLAWHRRGHEKEGWARHTAPAGGGGGAAAWPPRKPRRFPCPRRLLDGCQAAFGFVKQLRAHMLRAHRDVLPLSCLAAVAAQAAAATEPLDSE